MGFAPDVPHFANLPLAALQRVPLACAAGAHLMNFPFASRQGAAKTGVVARIANDVAASINLRIMFFLPPMKSVRHGMPHGRKVNIAVVEDRAV